MRRTVLLGLLFAMACGDPGPRDRSLAGGLSNGTPGFNPYALRRKDDRPTSVIGLAPDQLSHYYPANSGLVIRFRDLGSVGRDVGVHIRQVREALTGAGANAIDMPGALHRILQVPDDVEIDPVRPFAFVEVKHGWAAIIPTTSAEKAVARMKQLDGVYCVVGDPAVVATYQPAFRKGFYLPGDISVRADPVAARRLGSKATRIVAPMGVDLSVLDELIPPIPADIERLDLAIRVEGKAFRVDLRAAPSRDSPTAVYLERMRPASPRSVRWLPPGGTAYFEVTSPPLDWEGLLSVLLRDQLLEAQTMRDEQLVFSARRFLGALGRDAAAMVKLEDTRPGSMSLVAHLDDPKVARAFFDSVDHKLLLERIAGPKGELLWNSGAFKHGGVTVGAIRGHIDRDRLLRWRQSGDPALATLGTLLGGPAQVYVALVDENLCIVVGQKGSDEMKRLVSRLQDGRPADNDHNEAVVGLFPQRIAAASVDLASLFNGTRHAAPYWHENGRALRNTDMPGPMPVAVAVTNEGGALRVAVRSEPVAIVAAAARLRNLLNDEK